jgi:hypothetical protein
LALSSILSALYGAPGGIRTPDLLVRSQSLYPTELLAHFIKLYYYNTLDNKCQENFIIFSY